MKEIAKTYDHEAVEKELYTKWEKAGYFKPEINPDGEPYTIIMPPPNANGSLHVGHAVFVTLEDIMIRYARLQGKAALWLPGADHAGFETQAVFEKKLEKEGRSRFSIPRDQLYDETLKFTLENKKVMEGQLKRLGASCDWSREKFTLDPDIVKVVYETFVKLYEDGLAYRDLRLVNWCVKHQTSLSDLEVKHREEVGVLYYLKYGPITVATTRPETMFGDIAVAVHPDDKRYKNLIGKDVPLPLTDRSIPVIADDSVNPKFGTGAVKITPAHDPNDFEISKRHNNLQKKLIQVIDESGRIYPDPAAHISNMALNIIMEDMPNKKGGKRGKKIGHARAALVQLLADEGILDQDKTDQNYIHSIGTCYKCDSIIEPTLKEQWFIAVNKSGIKSEKTLSKDALTAVLNKKVKFITPKFEKIYKHWMTNIQDWNISRQIAWGIRIPAWYCGKCNSDKIWVVYKKDGQTIQSKLNYFLGENYSETELLEYIIQYNFEPRCNPIVGTTAPKSCECGSKLIFADRDVFDTWFSSGQWPFAALKTTQKKMGFAGDIVTQVFDTKTRTYRLRDHSFEIGDAVLFEDSSNGEVFGTGTITEIKKTTVDQIDLQDKKHWKVYNNVEDLIKAFKRHHPEMEVGLDTPVWIYTYKFDKKFKSDFDKFYPTDVMETGWDILFFWVARMIMLGLYETGEVPFKNVYLHGLVRDKDRVKMSKSKGNVIDPLGVADIYGADALRMALVFGTSAGNDAIISEEKIRGMRNFSNKIWNASRFVILRVTDGDLKTGQTGAVKIEDLNIDEKNLTAADKKIIKNHTEIIKSTTAKLDKFQFSQAGEELYEYFWHNVCDVYIEESKSQLDDEKIKINTKKVLIKVLSESLILLHPFVPFVTEAVWQELRLFCPKLAESVMIAEWPV